MVTVSGIHRTIRVEENAVYAMEPGLSVGRCTNTTSRFPVMGNREWGFAIPDTTLHFRLTRIWLYDSRRELP